MKIEKRKRSIVLRRRGWSYNYIAKKIDVSKSTLSEWLRLIPYIPNRTTIKRIKAGPAKSATMRKQQKIDHIRSAHRLAEAELGELSKRDLWMLGIGLYLGEGSKKFEDVRIANSDPRIIKLVIYWLIKVCNVPKRNIQIRLYAYPDNDIDKALLYWQNITKLPKTAFTRVQIDRRTDKKAKKWSILPNGTIHVIVRKLKNPLLGVALHRKIMGWIEAVHKSAGVV